MRRGLEKLRSNCCSIRKFLVSLLLLVGIHNVQSSDNKRKVMVTLAGATVQMHCTILLGESTNLANANHSIRWDFKQNRHVARSETRFIYGEPHCTRCNVSIAKFTGYSNTINTDYSIANVHPSDAGTYGCSFGANLEATHREYELEVIKPECELNVSNVGNATSEQQVLVNESDIVQLECNISYWGNWRPEFKCQPETIQIVSCTHSSLSGGEGLIGYISTFTAAYILHQKSITCTMDFTSTQLPGTKVPPLDRDFVAWTSPMLNVTYGYKGGNVTMDGSTVFRCLVDSNPELNVQWLEINYENENDTIVSSTVVSNVSVLDVCQIESVYQWAQSDQHESVNFTFRCVTYVDDKQFINGEEFFELTNETTYDTLCPTTTTARETGDASNVWKVSPAADTDGNESIEKSIYERSLPVPILLSITIPLVTILVICFVIITAMSCKYCKSENLRQFSNRLPDRSSGMYDNIYDIPEETTAYQKTFDANDGYKKLQQTITESSSSSGYDTITPPPTVPRYISKPSVGNKAVQSGTTQPYLSVVVDDYNTEYACSKEYYDDKPLTDSNATAQTNPYNKLDANTTEYMVPCVSANYASIKSAIKKNNSDNQVLSRLEEDDTIPVYAAVSKPLIAEGNTKDYQNLEFSERQHGESVTESKVYVPLKPSQSPPVTRVQDASLPMETDNENYNKLNLSKPANQDPETKAYVALTTTEGQSAKTFAKSRFH